MTPAPKQSDCDAVFMVIVVFGTLILAACSGVIQ